MPKQLPLSLFIMRITIVLFMVPWVVDKFTAEGVAHTAKIFEKYYNIEGLSAVSSYIAGTVWAIVLLAFALGFMKRISYGLVVLFHGVATLMIWEELLPWSDKFTLIFVASIPILGAMIALYRLRDYDTMFTIGK